MKQCAFCGSTKNVNYFDPEKGPVCLTCWMSLGDDWEEMEAGEKARKTRRLPTSETSLSDRMGILS